MYEGVPFDKVSDQLCVAFGSFDVACSVKEQPHKRGRREVISDPIYFKIL
jgi:hypothetical protein